MTPSSSEHWMQTLPILEFLLSPSRTSSNVNSGQLTLETLSDLPTDWGQKIHLPLHSPRLKKKYPVVGGTLCHPLTNPNSIAVPIDTLILFRGVAPCPTGTRRSPRRRSPSPGSSCTRVCRTPCSPRSSLPRSGILPLSCPRE